MDKGHWKGLEDMPDHVKEMRFEVQLEIEVSFHWTDTEPMSTSLGDCVCGVAGMHAQMSVGLEQHRND